MTDSENYARTLVEQGGSVFFGTIFRRASMFIFLIVITRIVSPEVYGTFTFALAIVAFSQQMFSLSLSNSISYFLPRYISEGNRDGARSMFRYVLLIATASSLGGFLFLIAIRGFVDGFVESASLSVVFSLLALYVPLWTGAEILVAVFSSVKKLQYHVLMKHVTFPVVKILLTVAIVLIGGGIYALVLGHVVAALLALLLGAALIKRHESWLLTKPAATSNSKEIMTYALPLVFSNILISAVGQVDFLMIGFFLENTDPLAYYKVSFQLAGVLILVVASINPIYKPLISETKGSGEAVEERYKLATKWVVLLTLPIVVVFVAAPRLYLGTLFTSEYTAGALAFTVLVTGHFVNSLAGPDGKTIEGLGFSRLILLNTVAMLSVNVGLNILLIPRYGITGAGIATGSALTVSAVMGVAEIYYVSSATPFTVSYAKVLVAGGVALGSTVMLFTASGAGAFRFLGIPFVVGLSYLATLYASGTFTAADEEVLGAVDDKLGRDLLVPLLIR